MEIKTTGNKPRRVQRLIFTMLDVLKAAGIPADGTSRRLERMAMACMAVADIRTSLQETKSAADGRFLTTREIIVYENANYGENISSGSYDDVRRQDLLYPVQAGVVLNSSALDPQATNNPRRGYALSPHFARLLKAHGTSGWETELTLYRECAASLAEELARKRSLEKIPVTLPSGICLELSAGEHNVLQRAIVEDFLPRFGMGAEVLYIGDTSDKFLYINKAGLEELNFFVLEHDELPDVVAYSKEKNLLTLVEAVHSAGPMSEIRVRKLRERLKDCTATVTFVTAFLNRKELRKWLADIAWETEVWLADTTDHMIHFNGDKYLNLHK